MNWNEGEHSRLRGKLNRLMRQTKGYSKNTYHAGWFSGLGLPEVGLDAMTTVANNTYSSVQGYRICRESGVRGVRVGSVERGAVVWR